MYCFTLTFMPFREFAWLVQVLGWGGMKLWWDTKSSWRFIQFSRMQTRFDYRNCSSYVLILNSSLFQCLMCLVGWLRLRPLVHCCMRCSYQYCDNPCTMNYVDSLCLVFTSEDLRSSIHIYVYNMFILDCLRTSYFALCTVRHNWKHPHEWWKE